MSKKYLIALLVLVVGTCSFFLYQSYWGPKAIAQRQVSQIIAETNSQLQTAGVTDTLLADEFYTKTYAELPSDIRGDLNQNGFFGNQVRSVILIRASLMTRIASAVLLAANQVTRITGLIIGRQVSEKEFKEAAELTLTKEGIGVVGGPAAEITLKVLDAIEGTELARQVYQVAKGATNISPQVLAAKVLDYGLAQQMKFINDRVSGAYQKIATLNPYTPGKTELWFTWVRSGRVGNVLEKKGMMCYYRDAKDGRYKRYFSDVVSTELLIKKK